MGEIEDGNCADVTHEVEDDDIEDGVDEVVSLDNH